MKKIKNLTQLNYLPVMFAIFTYIYFLFYNLTQSFNIFAFKQILYYSLNCNKITSQLPQSQKYTAKGLVSSFFDRAKPLIILINLFLTISLSLRSTTLNLTQYIGLQKLQNQIFKQQIFISPIKPKYRKLGQQTILNIRIQPIAVIRLKDIIYTSKQNV